MKVNVFRSLCEQLGYDPEAVLSVRVNVDQVVVVTKNESGRLGVTNYELGDGELRRASQGPLFAGPSQSE
jgi:hypothetical protein